MQRNQGLAQERADDGFAQESRRRIDGGEGWPSRGWSANGTECLQPSASGIGWQLYAKLPWLARFFSSCSPRRRGWPSLDEHFNFVPLAVRCSEVSRSPLTVRPSLSMDVDSHPPNEIQVPTSLCSCSFSLREFLTLSHSCTASGLARYTVRTYRKLLLPGRAP